MNDLLSAALEYHKRGWRVIPLHSVDATGACSCQDGAKCASAGKHPVEKKWQDRPRMSTPDIYATWDITNPPNLGLATGPTSGFWVLDIDPGSGGFESMRDLVQKHGPMPETFVVETGSGGYHYFFKLPVGIELRNSQNGRVGRGIDTRAAGGQVVAAPSVSSKGAYSVISDLEPAAAPDWLIELARKPEVTAPVVTAAELPRPEDIDPAEWDRLNRYAMRAIESERDKLRKLGVEGWNGAPWNATTFQTACSLLEFANSPWNSYSTGQAQADVMNLTPRDPGFDDDVVARTFDSALTTVGEKARPMPENRRAVGDALFEGVRERGTPTEAGGTEATPAGGRRQFFGGDKGSTPLTEQMALGVLDQGPVGFGADRLWWSYEGGVWSPDEFLLDDRLSGLLGDAWRTSHATNSAAHLRKRATPITGEPLEQLMNFGNGMLDWRTGELTEHDPTYASTVQLGTNWDPEATCPHFDDFLSEILHEDYVDLVWETIGYLMLSGNPLQVAIMFYGSGGNGKGTLMRVISDLLGRQNVANETLDDLTSNRFRAASLFGRIANLAGDIDSSYQESTAMFKRITGEDSITAEHKGMKPFQFESWAVPVFSLNKFFGSSDVTEGYLRRWVVLHFHKRITNAVLGLSDRLTNELPGIAVKGVKALNALMERGRFEPAGEALKGKQEFAESIDQVRKWLASGEAIESPGTLTPLATLYATYAGWADRSGHRRVQEGEFSLRLKAIGIPLVEGYPVSHEGLRVEARSMSEAFLFQ